MHIFGVILAAGKGERLHPLTQEIPKALIFIAGRTLLQWGVKRLSDAGCTNIYVGHGWKGEMVLHSLKGHSDGITADIIDIEVPDYEKGPLETFCKTASMVQKSPNVLIPVDLIVSLKDVKSIIEFHPKSEPQSVTLAVDYSSDATGSNVLIGQDDHIVAINRELPIEQRKAKSAMLLAFSAGFVSNCTYYLRSGESKIVTVLNEMILSPPVQAGETSIRAYSIQEAWFDIDTFADILKANRYLLENLVDESPKGIYIPPQDTMAFGDNIELGNNISIGSGVELVGPCLIQDNSTIEPGCVIGPYVSLDENTRIGAGTTIQDAVVFGSSVIQENEQLSHVILFKSKIFWRKHNA